MRTEAIERVIEHAKSGRAGKNWVKIGELASSELSALKARIAELEKQLNVACRVDAKDKNGFDWNVLGRIAELGEEIEDDNKIYRAVMSEKCFPDEMHCTCVPYLRKGIKELENGLDEAIDILEDLTHIIYFNDLENDSKFYSIYKRVIEFVHIKPNIFQLLIYRKSRRRQNECA